MLAAIHIQLIVGTIFIILYSVTILGLVLVIITENRNPLKTIPWVIVLLLAPGIGLLFYFFFGQDNRKQRGGFKKNPGRFAGSPDKKLRGLILKVYDFTVPELNRFRALANFTPDERTLFEYRAAGVPMEICAENMNVSLATAKRISRRVNSKIIRICGTL